MTEQEFANQRRDSWNELEKIVTRAQKGKGLRSLTRDEIAALTPLYRRISSDLAISRSRGINPDITAYLNGLAGRTHALLYNADRSEHPFKTLQNFYWLVFPALLQKRKNYFFFALLTTLAGGLFAYYAVINKPDALYVFVPIGFKSSIKFWKSGKTSQPPSALFSGGLMTHNFQVGIAAFTSGIIFCIPTIFLLFYNGATLGAMSALMTQVHKHASFWPGILPHGIAELTAIMICGAAGLQMGWAVVLPGKYSRLDALRLAGRDAVLLLLGTIPMFIFAGIIEGMFSHLNINMWIRLLFAGINGCIWYLYLFVPREIQSAEGTLNPTDA